MSHPLETSIHLVSTVRFSQGTDAERVALIDAWVRVREAEAQRNEAWQWHEKRCPHKITQGCECWSCVRLSKWESALVKARKQLEETR